LWPFKKKENIEERSRQADFSYGSFFISSFFGDNKEITEEQALKIPAITSCVDLISSSIAQLPIYLYQENKKGEVIKINDNRVFLLNEEPNNLQNGYNFKKQIVKDYLLYGASYTKIEKVRNKITAFYNLEIEKITITKYLKNSYQYDAVINFNYDITNQLNENKFYPEDLIIILRDSEDGITSKGALKNNSDIIKLAIDELDYSRSLVKNGALPIGILKTASKLTEKAIKNLRTSFERLYSGASNAGKTILLEEGLDYKPISMKPNDLDLTNSKKNTISEIARIFNVPEAMINSSANKYNSNEQNSLHFLQYCISPIINALEAGINKSTLLESEKKKGFYWRIDTSELLRTTESQKVETTVKAMQSGLYSINEARSKIDLPSLNEDYLTWSLGSIFYNPKTDKMTIPNLGVTLDKDENKTKQNNNNNK